MPGTIPIRAWSNSRLNVFETCRKRAELAYVEKIPEPPRPLPPGKTEHANDRGTRVHAAAELYVRGGVELVHELQWFAKEFEMMRDLYKQGHVSLEGEWAFDSNWVPCAWMSYDAWARSKLDALVWTSPKTATIIDYKTGKRWGNEAKHADQMQLYQLCAFLKYPELEEVVVELWYLDLDDIVDMTYRRDQGLLFIERFHRRGTEMTTCEDFPPNPSAYNCKWCPYKSKELGGTGHCSVGV